jgi:hypothetical protein
MVIPVTNEGVEENLSLSLANVIRNVQGGLAGRKMD